jgi:hypothetical protein
MTTRNRGLAVLALAFVCGCGSATGSKGTGGAGGSGSGGFSGTGSGGSGAGGFGTAGQGGGTASDCSAEAQYVYVIDATGYLYKFDPPTLQFSQIGQVNCNTPIATPFSMAVDRNANAWVVFTNGRLYRVDTSNAACTPTNFVAGQQGYMTFGMGFSTNGATSTTDTLFVTNDGTNGASSALATVDTQSLVLTPVGAYDLLHARAELTGTGDGRLFGAFEGTPYVVAQIDKTTAHILQQWPQTPIQYAPSSSNFAFAFWGGSFWLFVGPGTSTDVFQFDPTAVTTQKVSSVPFEIVGAGVSTCAPVAPPK